MLSAGPKTPRRPSGLEVCELRVTNAFPGGSIKCRWFVLCARLAPSALHSKGARSVWQHHKLQCRCSLVQTTFSPSLCFTRAKRNICKLLTYLITKGWKQYRPSIQRRFSASWDTHTPVSHAAIKPRPVRPHGEGLRSARASPSSQSPTHHLYSLIQHSQSHPCASLHAQVKRTQPHP